MYRTHTNAWGSKFDLAVKRSNVNVGPSIDLLSPMICAKIKPQGLFGSGEEDFFKVFNIYEHGSRLCQWIMTILAIFRSPGPRRLYRPF